MRKMNVEVRNVIFEEATFSGNDPFSVLTPG